MLNIMLNIEFHLIKERSHVYLITLDINKQGRPVSRQQDKWLKQQSCTGHGHVVVPTRLHITYIVVVGESLEVGDKEGRSSKLFVLPCEPELVTSVPRQGVEVCEEGGLLHLLPQEGVEGGQSGLVPGVDVTR